jgi:hypothetical protein
VRTALVASVAIALAVSVVAGLFVGAVTQYSRRISNRAAIKAVGVGVYQDPALTVHLTEIDWGVLEAGEEKNHTAYVKNESNVPVTLFLNTENWSPVNASALITVTWDYDGHLVDVDGVIEVTFTLAVEPSISGIKTFTFDMIIVGSG